MKISEDNRGNTMLKKALRRKQNHTLPSNFEHRMMQKIYLEDMRQRNRSVRLSYMLLGATVMILMTLAVLCMIFYTDISFDCLAHGFRQIVQLFAGSGFFFYLLAIVAILLTVDYFGRRWYYSRK